MKILIDNGHGSNTAGKCSPDKTLREYAYCREIANMVYCKLKAKGYDAELLTTETFDVPISTRVQRANNKCKIYGSKNVLLVSIHNNAAASGGKWSTARGFSVFCSKNASENSKRLARLMTEYAIAHQMTGNRSIPSEKFWTWSWTKNDIGILKNSNCPAVLTENFFQDNKEDVAYLLSEKGKKEIVDLHVECIIKYCQK